MASRIPEPWIISEVERARREREEQRPRVEAELPLPPPGWEPEVPTWHRREESVRRGVVTIQL